jgi:hypothetical protein
LKIRIEDFKVIFAAVGLIGILIFSIPSFGLLIALPSSEGFSQLYILGSGHTLRDLPAKIKTGVNYSIYIGIDNELGVSSYYTCFVKIKNETDSFPNSTTQTPSSLPVLYVHRQIIPSGGKWETCLNIQFDELAANGNTSLLSRLTINDLSISIDKQSIFNSQKGGYHYSLLFELWIFNSTTNANQYNNRMATVNLYLQK